MATSTNPAFFTPTITAAGIEAARSADNLGFAIRIDAVSFGTGLYDPTGKEKQLVSEVKRVALSAGVKVTANQLRLTSLWPADDSTAAVGEVGFWSGATLFAVWSRSGTEPLGHKSPGVAFVLINDLFFGQLPSSSVTIKVDPDASVLLAALAAHEGAANPHPNYVLASKVDTTYGGSASPLMDGTADAGKATRFAREDHVHPTDTSRAPLDSPKLTGTPEAPTADGNNTKQVVNVEALRSDYTRTRAKRFFFSSGT